MNAVVTEHTSQQPECNLYSQPGNKNASGVARLVRDVEQEMESSRPTRINVIKGPLGGRRE